MRMLSKWLPARNGRVSMVLAVGVLLLASACIPNRYGIDPMNPLPWVDAGYTDVPGTKTTTKTCTATECTTSWSQPVTRYSWQQYWRYNFHHHNEYTDGTHSDCWVMFDADAYDDFGSPGNVGLLFWGSSNTWGTPIEKSPDGHGGLEAGHGCGHTGTLKYHKEWVQIQRVVGLKNISTYTLTDSNSYPIKTTTTTTQPALNPT